jgi:G3E family GTPase
VTLVDAKHIWEHIDDANEAREQIAFADVIILNKIDLVDPADLDRLEARIRAMNAAAKVYRTRDANVAIDRVLDVGGFNLDRAMEVDPKFMELEYPFEWSGIYALEPGEYRWVLGPGPDPAIELALLAMDANGPDAFAAVESKAVLLFSSDAAAMRTGVPIEPADRLWRAEVATGGAEVVLRIARGGRYALFTQHHPDEFSARLTRDGGTVDTERGREYKPDHEHDDDITSVGIEKEGDLDRDRFETWIGGILRTLGADIFRMKGVLSMKGEAERYVFQGVHMLFDGRPDRPWGAQPRVNKLIFIGRNLDRDFLNAGFYACLA